MTHINSNDGNHAYQRERTPIHINGNNNTVTLSNSATQITVNGNHNKIHLAQSQISLLTFNGNYNTLTTINSQLNYGFNGNNNNVQTINSQAVCQFSNGVSNNRGGHPRSRGIPENNFEQIIAQSRVNPILRNVVNERPVQQRQQVVPRLLDQLYRPPDEAFLRENQARNRRLREANSYANRNMLSGLNMFGNTGISGGRGGQGARGGQGGRGGRGGFQREIRPYYAYSDPRFFTQANLSDSQQQPPFHQARNSHLEEANPQGMTQQQISRLPSSKCQKNGSKCTICIGEIECGQNQTYLFCMHSFHSDCIFGWFAKSTLCPNCKEDIRQALDKC